MFSIVCRSLVGTTVCSTSRFARQAVVAVFATRQQQPSLLAPPCCLELGSVREKHSKRQIKRMFKGPRQARRDARLGIERFLPPPPVEFEPIFEPQFFKSGWSKPAPPELERPEYTFGIKRTSNKPFDAVGFLPVYSKMRNDQTKIVTRIKKVTGNRERFIQELRAVLEMPIPKNPKDDKIRVRAGGTIDVNGDYVAPVKKWLAGLGF